MNGPTQPRATRRYTIALVWLAAFAVFALTAYPTITWWDSSSHSLAAATLGVTPPPGSLVLTLITSLLTTMQMPDSVRRIVLGGTLLILISIYGRQRGFRQ